jgi:carboxylesterase
MRTKAQRVHCIGISMGGLLALELAENKKPDSLVLLAPALVPRDKKAFLTRFFVPIADLLHIDLGYISVAQTEANKDHFYNKNPIRTVYQLVKLIRHVKPRLSKITAPVLIMQDKNDTSASPEGASYILEHIGSKQKMILYHDKGHVFTDRYEPALFNEIFSFISRKVSKTIQVQ